MKREKRTVTTPLGNVEVKVCTFGGQEYYYPEYESVKKLCEKQGFLIKKYIIWLCGDKIGLVALL